MTKTRKTFARALLALAAPLFLAACGVNAIPTKEEAAKAQWAEVQNQYQRRADLIPNLVETVKGYAAQEKSTLTEVIQARASATQIKVDASTLTDPAKFQEYSAAQDKLSGVLGRLMMVQEQYPVLKSNQNFLALQSQLDRDSACVRLLQSQKSQSRPQLVPLTLTSLQLQQSAPGGGKRFDRC